MDDDAGCLTREELSRWLAVDERMAWGGDAGAAALRGQLAVGVRVGLGLGVGRGVGGGGRGGAREGRSSAEEGPGGAGEGPGWEGSLLEALTRRRPVVEVLVGIKALARRVRDDEGSALRGGPATVLYYAAIAAALGGCGMRITGLADEQIRAGCAWGMRQAGAEVLRGVFGRALRVLGESLE